MGTRKMGKGHGEQLIPILITLCCCFVVGLVFLIIGCVKITDINDYHDNMVSTQCYVNKSWVVENKCSIMCAQDKDNNCKETRSQARLEVESKRAGDPVTLYKGIATMPPKGALSKSFCAQSYRGSELGHAKIYADSNPAGTKRTCWYNPSDPAATIELTKEDQDESIGAAAGYIVGGCIGICFCMVFCIWGQMSGELDLGHASRF